MDTIDFQGKNFLNCEKSTHRQNPANISGILVEYLRKLLRGRSQFLISVRVSALFARDAFEIWNIWNICGFAVLLEVKFQEAMQR